MHMYDLIDSALLAEMISQYFDTLFEIPFSRGMIIGAGLELIGYGIFKAVSLMNIKYE